MKQRKAIQISIPNPCHEDWNKMTPAEQGRFCSHCQKVVTDFTNYTDAQLYSFFSKRTEEICGRFYNHQLNREIHIPPQPHSRLYRYFIGLGLTLLFTHIPETNSRAQTPYTYSNPYDTDNTTDDSTDSKAFIKGKVIDEHKEPMIGAVVQVYIDNKPIGGCSTDERGNYSIPVTATTAVRCKVVFKYSSYVPKTVEDILVSPGQTITVNVQMELDTTKSDDLFIISGGKVPLQGDTTRLNIPRDDTAHVPLIDPFEPNKTIIDNKQ